MMAASGMIAGRGVRVGVADGAGTMVRAWEGVVAGGKPDAGGEGISVATGVQGRTNWPESWNEVSRDFTVTR
jgi:hypothetical protein